MALLQVSMAKNRFWFGSGCMAPCSLLILAFSPFCPLSWFSSLHSCGFWQSSSISSHSCHFCFSVLELVHVGAAGLYRRLRATSPLNLYCMSYSPLSGMPGDKSNALTASATKWWKLLFSASNKSNCWDLTPVRSGSFIRSKRWQKCR